MADPHADKAAELARYETRAKLHLDQQRSAASEGVGFFEVPYRAPYQFYHDAIRQVVRPGSEVLELGAGAGIHTRSLLEAGAVVTAIDISRTALDVLEFNLAAAGGERLRTRVADIEALPFPDASFDLVVSAGSLSYGDPATVDAGVMRVLRPGGSLVYVDSLNHNPVYRLNRWTHYLRGERTYSTLVRMPTLRRIQSIARHFESAETRFFGGLSWAMPVVGRIVGPARAAAFSDAVDRALRVKRSAFKFVLVARGRQ